jgi:hypothetical protein
MQAVLLPTGKSLDPSPALSSAVIVQGSAVVLGFEDHDGGARQYQMIYLGESIFPGRVTSFWMGRPIP